VKMAGKFKFLGLVLASGAALVGGADWVIAANTGPQTAQVGSITRKIGQWWNGSNNSDRIDYRDFDSRISGIMADPSMVGLSVAVIENGRISFARGYGTTAVVGGEPVNTHTVFRWASLSKGVAATMVGDLAAQGRLSLDAPLSDYATTLRLPAGNETRATVDDLLSHRLGVTRNAFDRKLEAGADPRTLRPQLATLSQLCAPGQCHAYQNVAFDAASEIVQNITGRPYNQVVARELFSPLGMTDASISRAGLIASKSWAKPHVGRRTVTVNDNYYRVPAAGGVNSSILDLARWMQAQMGAAPQVVPQRVLDRIHQPRIDTNRHRGMFNQAMGTSQYALGWRDYNYRGHRLIGHQGAVMGYRATVLFDPVKQSGIALLWNSQSGRPVGIQLELLDRLYGFQRQDWLGLDKAKPAPDADEEAG
jgi:beta-lactamase class C